MRLHRYYRLMFLHYMVKVMLLIYRVIMLNLYHTLTKPYCNPNYKEALYGKGYALNGQGNYAAVTSYYDKALAVDPNLKYALDGKQKSSFKDGPLAYTRKALLSLVWDQRSKCSRIFFCIVSMINS